MQTTDRIRAGEPAITAADDNGGALLFYSLGAALLALSAFILWYFPQH